MDRPPQPPEQIAEAGLLPVQGADGLGDIVVHTLVHQGVELPFRQGGKPAPFRGRPGDVLHDIVEEGADLGGVQPGGPPLLGPEAVLHEVGKVAGFDLVDAAGGHAEGLAVQRAHRPFAEAASGHVLGPVHGRKGVPAVLPLRQEIPQGARSAARGLQCRLNSCQAKSLVNLFLFNLQSGEQAPQPPHHKGGAKGRAIPVGGGIGHPKSLCGLHQGGIDVLELQRHFLHAVGGQADAALQQRLPVLLGEDPRLPTGSRQDVVVGPQEEQHLHLVPVVHGQLREGHLIQRRRDGAHAVLAHHQLQQAHKFLPAHRAIPQDLHKLIHDAAQQLPNLPVFVCQLQLSPLPEPVRFVLQLLGKSDLLQEGIEGRHFASGGFRVAQPLRQMGEGAAHLGADGIQLLQPRPLGGGPVLAIAVGIAVPVLLLEPLAAVEVPLDGVVLQQVALGMGDAGQAGLQVAEHVLVLVPSRHRVQS